jgi:exodeoxyribonuclease V beta subunit
MKYLNNPKLKIEKLNFLTLIGKKYSDKEIDIPIKRPILMIKEIMDKFNLTDDASLKLLYHSKKYDTLVDFVEEIDNYSEELPLKEFEGIVVMTIHKSKGLEFDNVIVMDNLGNGEKDNSGNIIFFYKDAKLKNLFLKTASREVVDSDYKLVLKNEEKLKKEDKLNLEYVAFTRAKNSLIILKRKDKKFFETSLDVEKRGSVIPSSKKEKKKVEKINLKLKNFGSQKVELKEEEYKPNDYEAIFKGDAIHYAFECDDIEAVRNLYGDFCEIEEVKRFYENAIKKLPKGKKEVPLIVNKEVKRIDLLTDDKIIDYKLTKPHDERNYIKQVKSYIEALKIITNKKLKGYLFYVDNSEFREV